MLEIADDLDGDLFSGERNDYRGLRNFRTVRYRHIRCRYSHCTQSNHQLTQHFEKHHCSAFLQNAYDIFGLPAQFCVNTVHNSCKQLLGEISCAKSFDLYSMRVREGQY